MQKYFSHYVLVVDSDVRMIEFVLNFGTMINFLLHNCACIFSQLKTGVRARACVCVYTHIYKIAFLFVTECVKRLIFKCFSYI